MKLDDVTIAKLDELAKAAKLPPEVVAAMAVRAFATLTAGKPLAEVLRAAAAPAPRRLAAYLPPDDPKGLRS